MHRNALPYGHTHSSISQRCLQRITSTLCSHRQTSVENRRARFKSCLLTLLGFSIPMALMALLVLGALSRELLEVALGPQGTETLSLYMVSVQANIQHSQRISKALTSNSSCSYNPQTPIARIFESLSVEQQLYSCGALVLLSFLLLIIARFSFR